MLDVLFHRLLGDAECIGDLFVGPALEQVLDNGHFPIGEVEQFLGLLGHSLLAASHFLHGDQNPGMLNAVPVG